jgi:hypothetical protein
MSWMKRDLKKTVPTSIRLFIIPLMLLLASCSKKPAELYSEGIKSFAAGNYEKAQENFANGIKKGIQTDSPGRSDSLYAGFVAANLVTGKYVGINAAYNDFTDGIHNSLVRMYGERAMKMVGITKEIIPYKTGGGNQLPPDFPQTVMIQEIADRQGFFTVKQQVDDIIKK